MVPLMPAGRKQRSGGRKRSKRNSEDMGQEADQAVTPAPRTPGKTAFIAIVSNFYFLGVPADDTAIAVHVLREDK